MHWKILLSVNEKEIGKASMKEKVVAYVFIFTRSLWILRKNFKREALVCL